MACKYKYKDKWYSEIEVKNQLLKDISLNDVIVELSSQMSFTVEINTAKKQDKTKTQDNIFTIGNNRYELKYKSETGNKYFKNNQEISEDEFIKANNEYINSSPTQYYSNLTVPGGTNYTENEIATPAITPSIKGHAQFATDKGIGWFRSDDKAIVETPETVEDELDLWTAKKVGDNVIVPTNKPTKTRRILEVQSDWGQKQRKSSEPDINIKYDVQQIINDLQKSGDLKIDCN